MAKTGIVYREKTYVCGEYLDAYIYPAFKKPGQRAKKAKTSSEAQRKLNKRHATEKLARLMHANFTPDDIALGLSYDINPEDDKEAARLVSNFFRKVRRLRKKLELSPLKYICVTEKSKGGRYHHHIVISGGIDRDILEALWGHGFSNTRRLQFTESGLVGLSKYMVKEPIGSKRWTASKNLVDPEPRYNNTKIGSRKKAAELAMGDLEHWEKLYPDYFVSEIIPFHNEEQGGVYLFARMYRRDGVFIKPKQKKSNGRRGDRACSTKKGE